MSDPGHNSVADDVLRAFFDRWMRLEEEKRAISDDLKELFAEAKGSGFDTKAMRAVFRDMTKDQADRQEAEAIYDLYWSSLNRARARPAPARVENIEKIEGERTHLDRGTPAAPSVQGGQTNSNPLPTSSPEAEAPEPSPPAEAATGAEPPPSAPVEDFEPPAFIVKSRAGGDAPKQDCLDPEGCALHFTSALCSKCNDARMRAKAA